MPLLYHKSSVKARQLNVDLTLKTSHFLAFGDDLDVSYELKRPLPASVDVFSHSDVVLIISVMVNGNRLFADTVKRSLTTRHLLQMLRNNATIVGVNNVSGAYIDESDGRVKVNVTPQRSIPPENPSSQVALVSIQLTYHFRNIEDDAYNSSSFSRHHTDADLLNHVVNRLLTYHFARRYPLIFGSFGKRLEQEKPYFRSIGQSLLSMARRSPNDELRQQTRRCIKILRRHLRQLGLDAVQDLKDCCGQQPGLERLLTREARNYCSDEDVINGAMQHLYKESLRPRLIKCISVTKAQMRVAIRDENRLSPHLVIHEADYESEDIDNRVDLMCSSDPKASTALSPRSDWSFLSRPPHPTDLRSSDSQYSGENPEEGEISHKFLQMRRANVCRTDSAGFSSEVANSSVTPRNMITGSNVEGQHPQDCSNFYDSDLDSDSDSLSITFLDENSSSTLYTDLAIDLDDDDIADSTCMSRSHEDQNLDWKIYNGNKETDYARVESIDRSFSTTGSSLSNNIPPTDHDLASDYDIYSAPGDPLKNETVSSSSYAFVTDGRPHTNDINLPCTSGLSDLRPFSDIPINSMTFSDDEDTDNQSLDCADEVSGEGRSSLGPGEDFSIFSNSHKKGFSPSHVLCTTSLEKALWSCDQTTLPEVRSGVFGSVARLSFGVDDGEVHMDFDNGLDSESDYDGFDEPPPAMQQCSNSGRLGLVETETILDSEDEEDGECWWSPLV